MTVNIISEDKDKIRKVMESVVDSLQRISDEREFINASLESLDDIGIEKKYLRRMAKTMHKNSFQEDSDENSSFEQLYSSVIGV